MLKMLHSVLSELFKAFEKKEKGTSVHSKYMQILVSAIADFIT
jgi:hypothetical protein